MANEQPLPQSGTLPWTRSCFVCGEANPHGLHLRSRIEGDRVLLDHTTREADLGYRHLTHGGIAMTLLDEVMTWAAILAARQTCVAAEVSVRLRRPIPTGLYIRVAGWGTDRRLRLALTSGEITDPQGTVLATATGKYSPMPAEGLHLCDKDFVISPESIPLARIFVPSPARAP